MEIYDSNSKILQVNITKIYIPMKILWISINSDDFPWTSVALTTCFGRSHGGLRVDVWRQDGAHGASKEEQGASPVKFVDDLAIPWRIHGADIWVWVNTYRYITIVGWTSIYQLLWGSLGTRVLTHPHIWYHNKGAISWWDPYIHGTAYFLQHR